MALLLLVDIALDSTAVHLSWARGRLFDQSIVETFAHMVSQSAQATCVDAKTSDSKRTRPQPLNTVELLKLASKQLGIGTDSPLCNYLFLICLMLLSCLSSAGPQAAMRAAEHLYLSGYLSYPRTESTAYPSSFDIRDALSIQRNHPDYGSYVQSLLSRGPTAPRAGHDVGDHPPITPVGLPAFGDLSGETARIYDLVVRHFLATVSPDARYEVTTARFRIGNENFVP